jgi:phage FluMu gp28-like protein
MDEGDYFNAVKSECADEESFLQEFCCVPGDDNAAFLSYEMLTSCEYPAALGRAWEYSLEQLAKCEGRLFVGVDIGRKKDLTVIWVLERLGDTFYTRKVITLRKTPFSDQENELYPILALPNVRRACIDETGIGMQFAERAQKKFGQYKVEPVTFTAAVKEELAYPMRAAFEDRTIRIPNDPKVRAALRALKKDTTAAGNIRFSADSGPDGHADEAWALGLGLHAGKTVNEMFAVVC